jgi:hypothetical protein
MQKAVGDKSADSLKGTVAQHSTTFANHIPRTETGAIIKLLRLCITRQKPCGSLLLQTATAARFRSGQVRSNSLLQRKGRARSPQYVLHRRLLWVGRSLARVSAVQHLLSSGRRGIRWRYWAEGECFSETPRFKFSNDEAARWNTASGGFVLFLRSSVGCGTLPTGLGSYSCLL